MKTFTDTVATLACTVVMSATLIVAAVGPAQADGSRANGKPPVASQTRLVA